MNLYEERITAARAERWASEYPGNQDPNVFTLGDIASAIFSVDSAEDALAFFESYVADIQNWNREQGEADGQTREQAESIARSNIGWMFGEGMAEDRIKMWVQTTRSSHPIFGTATPTPEEAFALGRKAGAS